MPQLILSIGGVEIKRVNLHKERTTLGRRAHNDIVLDDRAVSGDHCVFDLEGASDVYLEDIGSTNGTHLNDKMVCDRRVRLHDRDEVRVGKIHLQFLSAAHPGDSGQTDTMALEQASPFGDVGAMHARLQVLSGSSAGLEVPVVKAMTTFGKPGTAVVAISHRQDGFHVAVLQGGDGPRLNGQPIGAQVLPLSDQDELELAGTRLRFLLGP